MKPSPCPAEFSSVEEFEEWCTSAFLVLDESATDNDNLTLDLVFPPVDSEH